MFSLCEVLVIQSFPNSIVGMCTTPNRATSLFGKRTDLAEIVCEIEEFRDGEGAIASARGHVRSAEEEQREARAYTS